MHSMLHWSFHWNDAKSHWVIHRRDGIGGCAIAENLKVTVPIESDKHGRLMHCYGELIVNGATHIEGNLLVAAKTALIRKVTVQDQVVKVDTIHLVASNKEPR